MRWNGPFGNFTYLASGSVPGGVHDGDTLSATAVGDLITLYVNGVEITHAHDATFPTGDPGMAFWRGGPLRLARRLRLHELHRDARAMTGEELGPYFG